ncbi:hypothetical protein [Salibacterium aidingense]|uniref:hypothetical protein n=1 Tax=Salibacterium aidingense TaxID=384933 RepID=UPI003BC3D6B9
MQTYAERSAIHLSQLGRTAAKPLLFLVPLFFFFHLAMLWGQKVVAGQFPIWAQVGELLAMLASIGLSMFGCFVLAAYYYEAEQKQPVKAIKNQGRAFLLTTVIYLSLTALGFLLFVVPGILIGLFGIFYPFVLLEHNKKGLEAVKTSARVVKSCFFKVVLCYIMFFLLFIAVGTLFVILWPEYSMAGEAAAGALVLPIEAFFYYSLYRKSSFNS